MICRIHLKPTLGNILLTELRPDHIQKMYNDKLKNGRADQKGGLAPKTLKNIHNLLREALEQAVKNEIVVRNESKAAVSPKQQKKEMRVLSTDEQQKFINAFKGHRIEWTDPLKTDNDKKDLLS